jgi:hypothetical protein
MQYRAPVVLLLAIAVGGTAFAQTDWHFDPKGDIVMVGLFNPTYPPLARLANISGDVELELGI